MAIPRTTDRPPVGVPTHETILTDAALKQLDVLLRPGTGRSRYAIEEATFAAGRPDLLLLAASPVALKAACRAGLRVRNFAEAQVLAAATTGSSSGFTRDHARALERSLRSRGWTALAVERASSLVFDSLLIEAKHSEWRQGVRQLVRNRRHVHRAALLLPSRAVPRLDATVLRVASIGLLRATPAGAAVVWDVDSPVAHPSRAGSLWMTELAIRVRLAARAPQAPRTRRALP